MTSTEPTIEKRLCRHFGDCGGCRSQDHPYGAQLATKAAEMAALFAPFWAAPVTVAPSPRIFNYRNKVEFNFGRKQYPEPPPKDFIRESVLGFKRRGKWYWPLDIDECLIAPEGAGDLLAATRRWMHESGLRARDPRNHDGVLRHLVAREGLRTGERMVLLITTPAAIDRDAFVGAVKKGWPAHAILHGVYDGKADAALADELCCVDGADHITEALQLPGRCGTRTLRFRISPFSFFQTNTLATETLYTHIRDRVAATAPETILDLYGGAGGIAFACSELATRIVSVENVASATEDGRFNAGLNGIDNVDFVTADVRRYLGERRHLAAGTPERCTVVLDPPRSALHPKVIARIVQFGAPHIVYVSCNPKLLAREMDAFAQAYHIADLAAFDLFPHTPHVEVVAHLTRNT